MEFNLSLAVIFAYLFIVIIIGLISSRKVKSEKGFFLADRSIGWLTLTATITATTVGGSATIVAGGRIYAQGLPALWYDIGGGLGLIILGLFLANKVRKTGLITLPDITGSFFGDNVRIGSAILIIITEIAWVSLLIQASGLILSVVINVDYTVILFIITIGFILYTIIGGQYAVIYTDFIQFFIMIIGICFIAAPLLLWEALPNLNQLSSISLAFPVNQEIGILTAGSIFFMMFMPHIVGPDIYSKLLSAKDEKTAKKGAIFSGIFKLIFAIGIAIIALSALILHPGLSNPYLAIPTAVFNLSPIVSGIILAGFLSVMISSADSCLLSAGTILSVDIFKKNNINISRFGILIVGFGAFILAIFLGDILKTLQLAYTVFTAGLTLPIIFGFYREKTRVTSRGAFWSLLIGGSISILWLYFSSFGDYAVLVGLVFSLIPLLMFREGEK
ncbi:MAG: sodium:solute symporter family protein [Candidatus Thermoplasmatota archaeon]|jgi:SSS family solute:Na+ symporter|nr:sodium:solute symporter family protein [Candidatus Thermoplasmatota archaeon]MCK5300355.1 sodium:solute symporter family protein [Thermoplasmatales archaeon]